MGRFSRCQEAHITLGLASASCKCRQHCRTVSAQAALSRLVGRLTRCQDAHIVKLLGFARIPGPGGGFYIASHLFERGSLKDAMAGPKGVDLLWYKR